ncbi:hypothetical protein K474DRAFT_1608428 [Panus rudis PR-1116 ss-1]|nr:hypothetical protein K474DRAFT_1608428 [Panus rudis PR-1116 ss-1]
MVPTPIESNAALPPLPFDDPITTTDTVPPTPNTLASDAFDNPTTQLLLEWMWTGSDRKSCEELNRLARDVVGHPLFKVSELVGFDARRATAKVDTAIARHTDRWEEATLEIKVPTGHGDPLPPFLVHGFLNRSIVEIIKSSWSSIEAHASEWHYIPFRQFWQRPDGRTERVHDELYASEAFNQAYEDLQRQDPEPGCTLERVVCGLMFWSDSTHLANFGDASLWPLYMYFGNLSKYVRCKPSSPSCHHLAYIPKLPDTFYDFFLKHKKEPPTADVLTHCRRELMHAVWRHLLDEEFLKAYKHGIVIKCADGIVRRVYPRIFTYSADYPEK